MFYKLLLQKSEQPRHMVEGVLEFVEPDEKGRIRTETFEIEESEVEALEELIKKSAKEIQTLSFWNESCADTECVWCAIRFS